MIQSILAKLRTLEKLCEAGYAEYKHNFDSI